MTAGAVQHVLPCLRQFAMLHDKYRMGARSIYLFTQGNIAASNAIGSTIVKARKRRSTVSQR